jgi:hypothetical protein
MTEGDRVEVTGEEFEALEAAIRAAHAALAESGALPQLLRAFCVCGYPSGPGGPACAALRKLTGG